jgi:N-sulfoglucosamine sulfohydrolase
VAYPNVKQASYSPADVVVPDFLPDLPEVRKELAEYYQAISRMDQGIGFVLEALEKSGRAKDTLVLYVGDNGMPFPTAKASLYDMGLRVPLIVAGAAQGVNDALVHTPDIAPTAIEWMGLTPPKYPLHGRSLLAPAQRDEIFFSHTFHEINNYYPFRGVRTARWKYVRVLYPELEMPLPTDLFASPTWRAIRDRARHRLKHEAEELYDLQADPFETKNVAKAHPEVLGDLRARTQRFRKETSDGWLVVDHQMEGRL